ncbi:MAG: exodeoxyribonuclease III [Acidimicrobiales bacterium]|nr:exodeoxyribonuclease III [Acidimicrobiales bacterium]
MPEGDRPGATAAKQAARLERRQAALALRPSLSPSGPAPARFRVASWNLNSLRARLHAVERFLELARPDLLCLQETKAPEVPAIALEMFERQGYHVAHAGHGAYNGVAVAARHPIADVRASGDLDDEHLDREPRLITCTVAGPTPVRAVSVYVPHGRTVDHWHYEYKLAFLEALAGRVRDWLRDGQRLVVAGDLNVAATDSDVFHPDAFVGSTHVTASERKALARLLAAGLVDVDVLRWGERARRFTWWNHGIGYSRNLGMRLDVIAADAELARRLDTTWIDHTERGAERPSDHAALLADFHLSAP